MDFLGPIGLTIATAWLLEKSVGLASRFSRKISSRPRWHPKFDYRLVFLGAVLPDLIDKPLGFWIAPEFVNNSLRSVGHSIPFAVVFTGATWLLTRKRGLWPTGGVALALVAHLVFDQMWQMPKALLWPFLGWSFPEGTVPLAWWVHVHFGHPSMRPYDLLGTLILAIVAMRLIASGARRAWQRIYVWQRI